MAWWGKLLGGTFGFMLGGPLGAILGAALGHQYDKGLKQLSGNRAEPSPDEVELTQTVFFTATFSVMGYIAKADGKVTREEIAFAESVMAQMDLSSEQRKLAIKLFQEGKKSGFDLNAVLYQFKDHLGQKRNLLRLFLEIQVQAAYGDGVKHQAEHHALLHIAERIGISKAELKAIEFMVTAASRFDDDYDTGSQQKQRGRQHHKPTTSLKDAYAVLEIDSSSSDAEVKKAYRRMISRHHPDKLASKGLPEEMMKVAATKTHQIKNAYEMIKQSRGMR
jgi:DnaJ like chaperone protein